MHYVNFLKDHAKIVLCPLMRAVTYIDAGRDFKTYRFKLLRKNGMIPIVEKRLRYALKMIDFFIKPQATVVAASTATASGSSANTGMTPIAYAPDCRFQQVPPATGNQARENFPPEKHPATSAASHPTSAVSVPQPR
ncbi:unnamed protein product [Protopolystoma xenopodis]|uniref:POLO box domain-containing protein n=1 Tax=Protopolystoma xenopodis TaxID=117903 RepID=A0A3S5B065_9PLAT|nr:unnamed protein product [Protopolystoma xenopodis]